ncbi:hypothetical protein L208DRAFT_1393114 [Tricholoma matsutake]|nr:hypothetical protein L208DRAFT_1393114 [Tricholoma matsutake 945]
MKRKLLSQLKKMECHRELALAIAKNLGWEKAVQDIGGPDGTADIMSMGPFTTASI